MDEAVHTIDLTKQFGDFVAVDRISLDIGSEIFGLLGPNGAGKTTLARMLTTVLSPSSGTASVAGVDIRQDPNRVRANIGVVAQAMTLDVELTAWENLDIYGQYYHLSRDIRRRRIAELLEVVGLTERAHQPVAKFSGGMKRRLEIVRSLVSSPKILFLDEPTTGLDPQARATVWDRLRQIHRDHDITLVITTHYMDEAEGLCDRLAIVDHGKIVALGTPSELKRKVSGGDIVEAEFSSLPDTALNALKQGEFVLEVKKRENALTILVRNGAEAVPRIVAIVDANAGKLRTITLRELTLDDVFLEFTGRSLRE